MSKNLKLRNILFVVGLVFVILVAGLFSYSIIRVKSADDCTCSASNPHIISELGDNSTAATATSFNYYANNGIFAETGHYFKQTQDIIMTDNDSICFSVLNSNYDGNGKNFELKSNSKSLFESIGGTLSNLKVTCEKMARHGDIVAGITNELTGTISNVTFDGRIFISPTTNPSYVGGLVGKCLDGEIKNCNNLANFRDISYSNFKFGGLVGYQSGGTIFSSYNWGNIDCENSKGYIGGIVGEVENAVIKNCYNSGMILNSGKYAVIGGLAGAKSGSNQFSLIQNYNIGKIDGGMVKGALIGMVNTSSNDIYNFNYYLKETNLYSCGSFLQNVASDAAGEPKTENELASNSTFEGWLFGLEDSTNWVWSSSPIGLKINGVVTSKKLPRLTFESLEVLTPHTVSFDKNDENATGEMPDQELFEEKAYPLNECTFEKEGFKVIGWSTNPDGSGDTYTDGQTITIDRDITLYAIWDYETHFVLYFDANGGESSVDSKYVHTGVEIGELPVPTRTGYNFLGWYASSLQTERLEVSTIFTLEYDITATAEWEVKTYIINYLDQPISDGGEYTKVGSSSLSYTAESTHPTLASLNLAERASLVAVGLSQKTQDLQDLIEFGSAFKVSDLVVDSETNIVNIYVQYAKSDYTLTLDAGNGKFESNSSNIKKITVSYGKTISNLIEEVPKYMGYTLSSWELERLDGSKVTITSSSTWEYLADLTATAMWTPIQYTVNFYMNVGTSEEPFHVENCIYDSQVAYSFPIVEREGYTFQGYSQYKDGTAILANSKPGGSGTYNNLMTASGTLNLYAIWKENTYTLNYFINNPNLTSESDFSETYTYSQTAKVKDNSNFPGAGVNTRYILNRFSTLSDGTGTTYSLGQNLTKKITEDGVVINLYAIWETVWNIEVEKHSDMGLDGCDNLYLLESGSETQYSSKFVINGTKVTLVAELSYGYGFIGWYNGSNTFVSGASSYTFTPSSDGTYYAKWELTIVYCACMGMGCGNEAEPNEYYCASCLEDWCSICSVCLTHGDTSNHIYYTMSAKSSALNGARNVTASTSATSIHKGQSVIFSTSASSGTFLGWYTGAQTSSTFVSGSTYYEFTPSADITLYAIWKYYDCACSYCNVEVNYDGEICSECSSTMCPNCSYCDNHATICGNCGDYCSNCRTICSECGRCSSCVSFCGTCGLCYSCCDGHGYECGCSECYNIIYSGYYCSYCSFNTNCGHCSYHNGGKCPDCGNCNNCCSKSECDCSACSAQTCNPSGVCDNCSTTTCRTCGYCENCCRCKKCLCCDTLTSNASGYCSSCTSTICSVCNNCTNHHTCYKCACGACENRVSTSGYVCGASRGCPGSNWCSSCGMCSNHYTKCSNCGLCEHYCKCNLGNCDCCGTYGPRTATGYANGTSGIAGYYCSTCAGTGWCSICHKCGSCCTCTKCVCCSAKIKSGTYCSSCTTRCKCGACKTHNSAGWCSTEGVCGTCCTCLTCACCRLTYKKGSSCPSGCDMTTMCGDCKTCYTHCTDPKKGTIYQTHIHSTIYSLRPMSNSIQADGVATLIQEEENCSCETCECDLPVREENLDLEVIKKEEDE